MFCYCLKEIIIYTILWGASFSTSITNGFIEGCNNKIKVLKRNAYGYRNFKRFRNRILHMFSNKHINSTTKQATV
ncbi:transposase [Ruminococcus sp.]|uniref:transposase n=1 Tax=Ruminococcus sp. TaxID=41978 RepID=UPI003AB3CD34